MNHFEMNMKNKTKIFSIVVVVVVMSGNIIPIFAAPPPLESNITTSPSSSSSLDASSSSIPTIGKVTIPISESEQIIIDLPIKSDSKINIVPIK